MQQELNVDIVKNTNPIKSKIDMFIALKNPRVKLIMMFIVGFLFARVNLLLNVNDEKGFAPFGLAYIMAIFVQNKRNQYVAALLGVVTGYLSIQQQIVELYPYLFSIIIMSVIYFSLVDNIKKFFKYINAIVVLISFILCGIIIYKYEFSVNLMLSGVQLLMILPVYYIVMYAVNSLEDIHVNKIVSTEEIISVSIMLCLIVAGFGNFNFYGYSIRNIIALVIVFLISYCGGAAYGTMIGVLMGVITGLSVNNMEMYIAFFGIGGLIVGVFKDTGKIVSMIAGSLIYLILGVYSNNLDIYLIVEVLLSAGLFLIIPKTLYKDIQAEINPEKRKNIIYNDNLNGIKEQFNLKVNKLTDVMYAIARCLNETTANENVSWKNKGSALIENLADRSCSQCINRSICWEKEFRNTYVSFQTMINNYQNGEKTIPSELKNKCIKKSSITKNAESVVKNYNSHEIVKDQLFEGRKLLSQHICNIGNTLNTMLNNFKNKVIICDDMEKSIKKSLNKNDIMYNEVFCYTDYNGRIKIRLNISNYKGYDYCSNSIIPVLNKVMKLQLAIVNEECIPKEKGNEYVITIEEVPKYYLMSYAAVAIKNGENQTGDYYSFGKTTDGYYTFILSDGMGSGNEAALQSKSIVNLTEHLTESGFESSVIVDTINSIMSAKFSENEKYATLDLGKVDLYNGNISFIKMGAAPSFIKRNKQVKKIISNNLPFGIIDEIEAEVVNEILKPGDIIISVSDGILDVNKLNAGDDVWLEEYLKENHSDPVKLAKNILDKAKMMSKEIIKDDMTVIVSKMYCV